VLFQKGPNAELYFRSHIAVLLQFNPLNAELNPICHLLALLGGATIVVVSRLRVKRQVNTRPQTAMELVYSVTG
jgi:hypothetical protein